MAGIDSRRDEQLTLLKSFEGFAVEMPFRAGPVESLRYHLDCTWFADGDGVALYSMLRQFRPKRYLEIGSGWSSACALDTADRFLDGDVEFTFIEPNPERLRSVLRSKEKATILAEPVSRRHAHMFEALQPGDFLFIDSSHVSRVGSEVNFLFLDVIPHLPAGVHIHVHDIFWPFTYPTQWIKHGRAWNEAYLLRALMCDNDKLQTTWFNNYLKHHAFDEVSSALPAWAVDPGSSIWLETR